MTGAVITDRIPESLNESGIEGVSIGVGKSNAQLVIGGSNPNIGKIKEDSPNRGESRKGNKG